MKNGLVIVPESEFTAVCKVCQGVIAVNTRPNAGMKLPNVPPQLLRLIFLGHAMHTHLHEEHPEVAGYIGAVINSVAGSAVSRYMDFQGPRGEAVKQLMHKDFETSQLVLRSLPNPPDAALAISQLESHRDMLLAIGVPVEQVDGAVDQLAAHHGLDPEQVRKRFVTDPLKQ